MSFILALLQKIDDLFVSRTSRSTPIIRTPRVTPKSSVCAVRTSRRSSCTVADSLIR
jgi:hypothetical protein